MGDDPLASDAKASAIRKLFQDCQFELKIRKVTGKPININTTTPQIRSQYSLTRLKLQPELANDDTTSSSSEPSGSTSDLYEGAFERKVEGCNVAKEVVRVAFEFDNKKCDIAFVGHDLEIRVTDYEAQFNERIRKLVLLHVSMLVEEQELLRPGPAGIHKFVKHDVDALAAEDREIQKRKDEQEAIQAARAAAKARREEARRLAEQAGKDKTDSGQNYFETMGILSVPDILTHVFDAADEDIEGILKHCDVLRLLEASLCTGRTFGVTTWDVRLILATADEDENGLIAYIPWLRGITEIYENIKHRREEYIKRFPHRQVVDVDPSEIPPYLNPTKVQEVLELLQGEELTETARVLIDACSQNDPSGTGFVKRATLTNVLKSRQDRVSMQETRILMQLVEETVVDDEEERVLVNYERLRDTLIQMRIEKIMNPVLESDIKVIRKEFCLLVRREQIDEFCSIWQWKNILMRLDKLLLSRFQIHILLCVIPMDTLGMIDVNLAVQICVTMIERFFNPETMYETATKLQLQLEAEAKEKELRELQEMSGQKRSKSKEDAETFIDLALRDNKDEVEKNLLLLFQSIDEEKKGAIPAYDMLKQLYTDWEITLTGGGLTDAEKRGFIGEILVSKDEDQRVIFAQHVKTWVPLLFEFRKNSFYKKLLEKDNVFQSIENPEGFIPLLDLSALEKEMPLFGAGLFGKFGKQVRKRRNSKGQGMAAASMALGPGSKEMAKGIQSVAPGAMRAPGGNKMQKSMAPGAMRAPGGNKTLQTGPIRMPGSKQLSDRKLTGSKQMAG